MATITRSAGAMLGAVASAADAVSKTITVAASSVSLLENYVDEALHNQMVSSDERQHQFLKQSALEQAAFDQKINRALSSDQELKELYDQNLARLLAKSNELKAKKDQ